jgi:hypothetical protein
MQITHAEIKDLTNVRHLAEHVDLVTHQIGENKAVVGFLVHDEDCPNPLTDCDGMGAIHTARRHAGRHEHQQMQEALGLDSDWSPDEGVIATAIEDLAVNHPARAHKLDALDLREQYETLRNLRLIGNPFVQVLDVYEHSGTSFSISGEGTQCRWDTARGGAVWVPDDVARKECESRSRAYAFGRVLGGVSKSGRFQALFEPTPSKQKSLGMFEDWGSAYKALCEKVQQEGLVPKTLEQKSLGQGRAAEELARQALAEYNAWLNGDCWGCVVIEVELDEHENFKLVRELDACWGYIGSDYAEEALQEAVTAEAARLSEPAVAA